MIDVEMIQIALRIFLFLAAFVGGILFPIGIFIILCKFFENLFLRINEKKKETNEDE